MPDYIPYAVKKNHIKILKKAMMENLIFRLPQNIATFQVVYCCNK